MIKDIDYRNVKHDEITSETKNMINIMKAEIDKDKSKLLKYRLEYEMLNKVFKHVIEKFKHNNDDNIKYIIEMGEHFKDVYEWLLQYEKEIKK